MNFQLSTDDYSLITKIVENIYIEAKDWDFDLTITKEGETYYLWLEEKEE